MINFSIGISTAMIFAFSAIITIYLYYFRIERKRYLLYWIIGWLFYSLRIFLLIILTMLSEHPISTFTYDISGLLSASFIYFGTNYYFDRKIHSCWSFFTTMGIIWFALANLFQWSFFHHYTLPTIFIGTMLIHGGIIFWKNIQLHPITRIIAILFILMGIHKYDYLIIRQIDWLAPFGYLMNEIILIFIALSFAIFVNIRLRKQLSETESRIHALANTSQDIIYSLDLKGYINSTNRQFQEYFSLDAPLDNNKHITEFFSNDTFQWNEVINKIVATGEVFQTEYTAKDGEKEKTFQITLSPIHDKDGNIVAINGIHHDLTNYKEKDQIIEKMVYKDLLTGLPNSYALYEHLFEKIVKEPNHSFAVLYIGLDQFKKINDLSGPAVGDELLKMFGNSLQSQIASSGFVCRYSGDEFVIVTNKIAKNNIDDLLALIQELFKTRWILFHQKFHLSASIGISIYPKDGNNPEDLLKNANMALHYAKETGKNRILFYDAEIRKNREKNDFLEKELAQAIENEEFTLYFQPQIHTKTKRLRGFEALIRWANPSVGIISPNEFIPMAEKSGLIVPIGEWVLNEACRVLNILHHRFREKYIISVNISPKQLQQDDFVEKLEEAIQRWNIPVNYLELEITESIFIDSFDTTVEKLTKIYNLGVRLSLDDFGTGYSSFNYLTRLPIHLLKIDKSFVNDIHIDDERAVFLEKLIDLVKQLKLEVLVEGVEKKEQLDILKQWNCDFVQGYYTSKPMKLCQLFTYLEKYA